MALTAAGRAPDAITALERILAVQAASSGELAESLLPTLTSLANIFLLELHNPGQAVPYLERIVAVTEHARGPNDLRLIAPLRQVGDALAESDEAVSDLRNYILALKEQQQSQAAQPYLD